MIYMVNETHLIGVLKISMHIFSAFKNNYVSIYLKYINTFSFYAWLGCTCVSEVDYTRICKIYNIYIIIIFLRCLLVNVISSFTTNNKKGSKLFPQKRDVKDFRHLLLFSFLSCEQALHNTYAHWTGIHSYLCETLSFFKCSTSKHSEQAVFAYQGYV